MTNLRHAIGIISISAVLTLSCSKDKDSGTPPVDPCDNILKVEQYNYYGNLQPWATIEYDEKGRVQHVTGEGLNASTYAYNKDNIVLTATDIYGANIGLTYFLDANGRVKGTSYFDNQFTYNADGYLVSFRQPYGNNNQIYGSTLYTLKYENGDLTEIFTTENVSWKKINFKYYDEPNQDVLGYNQPLYIGGVLGDRNSFYLIKAGFFGKTSAHLYKTLAINDAWSNGQIQYTKDAKGRIKSTVGVGGYSFTYQCP
ncbi:MAG TPA: DUF4595 domain-containing protein [Niastella sp.]